MDKGGAQDSMRVTFAVAHSIGDMEPKRPPSAARQEP